MAVKVATYQNEFHIGDLASPVAYAKVPSVSKISPPKGNRTEIDVTTHDSPGATNEFLPSFRDPGDCKIDILFDPNEATHGNFTNGLYWLYLANGNPTRPFKIVMVNNSPVKIIFFNGFVKTFEIADMDVKTAQMASCTIRATGLPNLT